MKNATIQESDRDTNVQECTDFSEMDLESLGKALLSSIADQYVADDVIKPKGKSKQKLALEALNLARKHMESGNEFSILQCYDSDLLKTAQKFRTKGMYRESCLFYATWFEHRINFMVTRERFGLREEEKQQMIRKVSLLGKLTWLLPALGFKRISPANLKVIRKVVETRNAFIHFKYKNDADFEDDETLRIKTLLGKVEKTRRYFEKYEGKNLYGGLKGFFKSL